MRKILIFIALIAIMASCRPDALEEMKPVTKIRIQNTEGPTMPPAIVKPNNNN